MSHPLLARVAHKKDSSEDLYTFADFCIVPNLGTVDPKEKPHPAIIIKCPYCRMDMASTRVHTIKEKCGWIRKLCGLPAVVTVSPMLQCPYTPSHRFHIRSNKIIPA